MDRAELKAKAKEQIRGNIGILFLVSFLIAVISGVASGLLRLIPFVGSELAVVIITPAFLLSMTRIYLALAKGVKPEVGDIFSGFDDFWAAFKVTFLMSLYTYLWSLLFVIPGIVKGLSYSMSVFVLAENKGMSARECIRASKEMTDGYKMELFVLGLSFFGWALLGAITLGIAYIWIMPYMQATYVNAYNKLKPNVVAAQRPEVEF